MFSNSRMELDFKGLNSIRSLIDREAKQLDDLISKIREEEKNCDEYLQKYCPHFYSEISFSSPVTTWLGNKQIEEENNAKERIRKALRNIDDYVKSRSRELANSWADGLKLHFSDISTYGVGRPWGTEIRQRLATAFGLKKEVNSLWELGLNSLANSQHVYLGEHFIGLIKQDPAMEKIREHLIDYEMTHDYFVIQKVVDDIYQHMSRQLIEEQMRYERLIQENENELSKLYHEKEYLESLEDIEPQQTPENQLNRQESEQVEIQLKYAGYIKKEEEKVARLKRMEAKRIPANIDYEKIDGLATEGRQKLEKIRPETLAQASRISGVNPADIAILSVYIRK